MRFSGLATAVILLAAALPALAGTVITSETTAPQKEIAGKSVVYIDRDRVRIEAPAAVTIFRGDQNVAYTLLPAQKKFVRLTAESMKDMAAAMEKARAELAEQMKSMPPAQRAQIEKMMAGMGAPDKAPNFSFRKAGGTGTVGKWQCDRIEELADGQPQATLCVAKTADLGLGADDVAALQHLSTFMLQAAPQSAASSTAMDPQALEKAVGYPAFAVQVDIPAVTMKTTTKSIEKQNVAADLFEVPAGYQEEKMTAPR